MSMELNRSLTFPLSHAEATTRTSPFAVKAQDAVALEECEAFQIIRELLANDQQSAFCEHHQPACQEEEQAWLLHRDITHALILPISQIYREASSLAESLLSTRNTFDLELAFRSEARGAFSWLQCFFIDEADWCATRGCPACVVTHVLQAEPTIRMVLVTCRLSQSLREPGQASSLPVFDFWLSTLKSALDEDPFWGPDYWKDIEARALRLEKGIEQLVQQSCQLGDLLARKNGDYDFDTMIVSRSGDQSSMPMKLKPSDIAKKQVRLAHEEQRWMQKIVLGCWTTLLADAAQARRKSRTKRSMVPRIRSFTS